MGLDVAAVERLVSLGMLPRDALDRARGEGRRSGERGEGNRGVAAPACPPASGFLSTKAEPPAPRTWRFTVLGRPVGKARARVFTDAEGRVQARTPKRTRVYERRVGEAAVAAGVQLGAGPARLHLEVWTEDDRPVDLDNILKACGDALVRAGCIDDDTHQVLQDVRATWRGVDKARPRVEVLVELVEPSPTAPAAGSPQR